MKIKCNDGRTREFVKERQVRPAAYLSSRNLANVSWKCALCNTWIRCGITAEDKKRFPYSNGPDSIRNDMKEHCCNVCDVCHKAIPKKTFYITDGSVMQHISCCEKSHKNLEV